MISVIVVATLAILQPCTYAFVHTAHTIVGGFMAHHELLSPYAISAIAHTGHHSQNMQLPFLTPTTSPIPKDVMNSIEKVVVGDLKHAYNALKNTIAPKHVEGSVASSLAETIAGTVSRQAASALGTLGDRDALKDKLKNPSSLFNMQDVAANGEYRVSVRYNCSL